MGNHSLYMELRNRYNSGWTPLLTEFPNESFNKPGLNGAPAIEWARFNLIEGQELQMDIGADTKIFRTHGQLIIQMFAPLGAGSVSIRQKADTVADMFRNWKGATVICEAPIVKTIGNDGFGWYQINVIIPFKRDELH